MKKNASKSKKTTLRQAFSINRRAFGMLFHKYPQMFLSRLIPVVFTALTPYIGIYLSARIIEELSGSRDPLVLRNLVLATLLSAAAISLVTALLNRWRETVCAAMYLQVEGLFAEKMLSLDYLSIDDTHTHEMLSTIRQNRGGGGWGLSRVIGNVESLLSAFCNLFGGIALTVTLFVQRVPDTSGAWTILNHPLFVVVVAALLLFVTYLAPALSTKANSYYALASGDHNLGNRLFGFFGFLGNRNQYAADIRIYRQDKICARYCSDKTAIFGSQGPFARLARGPMGLYNGASAAVSVLFTGLVYVFVCLKAWAGAFGVGAVTQYVASITRLSGSLSSLLSTTGDMRNNAPFLALVFEFLDIPAVMQKGEKPFPSGDTHTISFHDVSFRYPGAKTDALSHVNLTFVTGERMAVVGRNGSGKSTFIKLLSRLYDPTEGKITIDGVDIREIDYTTYLAAFAVVFQDFKLFSLPLGENVGAGKAYDRDRAKTDLERAGFGERLQKLEQGLDTYLYRDIRDDGTDLSGGEAQKVAIARALYKDAPFIILDEPTAALDPIAESKVYESFDEIVGCKTAVYISHRLSSCRFCRDILVFDEGKLVERGTHEALVTSGGKYAELWEAQAQYYRQ